jgi:hypothetical protein
MNFGDGTPGSSPRANVRRSCEARKRWTRSTGSSATRLRYSLGATQMGNYSRRTAPLQCPDHPRRLHATPISSLDRHRPRPTRRHGRRVIACRCPPFFACRSRAWQNSCVDSARRAQGGARFVGRPGRGGACARGAGGLQVAPVVRGCGREEVAVAAVRVWSGACLDRVRRGTVVTAPGQGWDPRDAVGY